MRKFTPGPWKICAGESTFVEMPKIVRPIKCGSKANASLIAAAPDMYEALDRIAQLVTNAMNGDQQNLEEQQKLRNLCGSIAIGAISKADGW